MVVTGHNVTVGPATGVTRFPAYTSPLLSGLDRCDDVEDEREREGTNWRAHERDPESQTIVGQGPADRAANAGADQRDDQGEGAVGRIPYHPPPRHERIHELADDQSDRDPDSDAEQ